MTTAAHRLIGRLWTLERMFYYIYGGWGQGLEINDFPPSVKYLFSKQIVDESTHEMLYLDALLHKGFRRHAERRLSASLRPFRARFGAGLLCLLAAQPGHLPASDPDRGTESRPQDPRARLDGGADGSDRRPRAQEAFSRASSSRTAATSIWAGASSRSSSRSRSRPSSAAGPAPSPSATTAGFWASSAPSCSAREAPPPPAPRRQVTD